MVEAVMDATVVLYAITYLGCTALRPSHSDVIRRLHHVTSLAKTPISIANPRAILPASQEGSANGGINFERRICS